MNFKNIKGTLVELTNFGIVEIEDTRKVQCDTYVRKMCKVKCCNKYESDYIWLDYSNIMRNRCRNPMTINIVGGYIGVGPYKQSENKELYDKWIHMLTRVNVNPRNAYKNVTICEEWLNFQNFAKWSYSPESNYRPNFILDKDLFSKRDFNKSYSPETSVYLPFRLNNYMSSMMVQIDIPTNFVIGFGRKRVNISYVGISHEDKRELVRGYRYYTLKTIADEYLKTGQITKRIYDAILNMCEECYGLEKKMLELNEDIKGRIKEIIVTSIEDDLKDVTSETRLEE